MVNQYLKWQLTTHDSTRFMYPSAAINYKVFLFNSRQGVPEVQVNRKSQSAGIDGIGPETAIGALCAAIWPRRA